MARQRSWTGSSTRPPDATRTTPHLDRAGRRQQPPPFLPSCHFRRSRGGGQGRPAGPPASAAQRPEHRHRIARRRDGPSSGASGKRCAGPDGPDAFRALVAATVPLPRIFDAGHHCAPPDRRVATAPFTAASTTRSPLSPPAIPRARNIGTHDSQRRSALRVVVAASRPGLLCQLQFSAPTAWTPRVVEVVDFRPAGANRCELIRAGEVDPRGKYLPRRGRDWGRAPDRRRAHGDGRRGRPPGHLGSGEPTRKAIDRARSS